MLKWHSFSCDKDKTKGTILKTIFLFFVAFISFQSNPLIQGDFADELASHFRQGNSKEIAKTFASTVDLILIDQEDVYNKAQAEQILKDFFLKNPPQKSSVLHRLNNNPNYRLAVLSLSGRTEKYRVTITLKKISNSFLITESRIETER